MNDIVTIHDNPETVSPVLLVSLDGWIDAGMAAASAVETAVASSDAQLVATFDADRLLDHRARRPIMHLVNGLVTGFDWPGIELHHGIDTRGSDVLILHGAEPDFEWGAFTDAVLDLAEDFEVRMIVYFGAYPAAVPHTRPVAMSVTTSSPDLAARLNGYVRGTLDVPAGIQSVIDWEANRLGIPTVGIWAQVPHYVSSMNYPAASLALLDALDDVADIALDPGQLRSDTAAHRHRLDGLVADNSEHQAMIHQLETAVDAMPDADEETPGFGFDELPTGDEIAAELQEFLHRNDDD